MWTSTVDAQQYKRQVFKSNWNHLKSRKRLSIGETMNRLIFGIIFTLGFVAAKTWADFRRDGDIFDSFRFGKTLHPIINVMKHFYLS